RGNRSHWGAGHRHCTDWWRYPTQTSKSRFGKLQNEGCSTTTSNAIGRPFLLMSFTLPLFSILITPNCEMRIMCFRFRTNLTKALHGPPLVVYTISRAVQEVSRVFAKEAAGSGRSNLASRREGESGGEYTARVSKATWDAVKR